MIIVEKREREGGASGVEELHSDRIILLFLNGNFEK